MHAHASVSAWLKRARSIAAVTVAALALAAFSAPTASAQSDDAEDIAAFDGMGSGLRKSNVESMIGTLNLPPEQRKTVLDLYSTFSGQVSDATSKMMEFQKSMASGGLGGMPSKENIKKAMEAYENFTNHKKELEARFMEDFKSVLTPEQAALWPKVERRRRLAEAASMGAIGGGVINLVTVADQTLNAGKLPPEAEPVIDTYEQEMDVALTDLLAWRAGVEKRMKEIGDKVADMSMEEQQKFGMEMMAEMRTKSAAASEVNNRSLPKIAAVLPEALRDRFQIAYYRAAYFQFFDRGPSIDKAFDAAAKIDGLSDEQRTSLAEIHKAHDAETLALYRGTAQLRDKELAEAKDQMAMFSGPSLQTFMQKGPEITKATVAKVRAALTPEQLAKLPAPFKPADVKEPTFEE